MSPVGLSQHLVSELGYLGRGSLCRGVPAMAVFVGGCAKLRAVYRPMEVRGAATVMVDVKATRGETTTSTTGMEVMLERLRGAASAWQQRRTASPDVVVAHGFDVERRGNHGAGATSTPHVTAGAEARAGVERRQPWRRGCA